MKKIILLTAINAIMLLFCTQTSFAQLSTGEPVARVMKTGNRPTAGDWGIFVGVSYSDFEGMFSKDMTFEGFPLVNVKYYKSDNVEYRLGLQFQGTTERISGDIVSSSYNEETGEETSEETSSMKLKQTLGTNRITPGIAYHFSNKNLLDVYVGGQLPIGWNRDITLTEEDDYSYKVSKTPFTIGIGGFIGLQAFVADLPLAIGLEYGISFMKEFGAKSKCTLKTEDDDEKYFTLDDSSFSELFDSYKGSEFDKLSTSRKSINNDIRVTLSYYFGGKNR